MTVPAHVEEIALTALDGVRLDARLHRPSTREPLGVVVQAHGITADMDEGGMFARLADQLTDAGFVVLRFSFRGHGRSGGSSRGVTIAGELLDLQAALDYVTARRFGEMSIVAASFGAVATAQLLHHVEGQLRGLVLWNPVLDLRRTFLEPELPWGKENFGPEPLRALETRGFLTVDDDFELGKVLFDEFRCWDPRAAFVASSVPALVVHGDRDTAVSYEIALDAAAARGNCDVHTVVGSDHGFDSREREDEAIGVTVDWLARQYAVRRS